MMIGKGRLEAVSERLIQPPSEAESDSVSKNPYRNLLPGIPYSWPFQLRICE